MAWVMVPLGYGRFGIADFNNPTESPQVTVNGTIQANAELASNFGRILTGQVRDTEEIRIERPTDYNNGFEYVGMAPTNSSTTASVWFCVRRTWANKKVTRIQYQENIAWDDRAEGW